MKKFRGFVQRIDVLRVAAVLCLISFVLVRVWTDSPWMFVGFIIFTGALYVVGLFKGVPQARTLQKRLGKNIVATLDPVLGKFNLGFAIILAVVSLWVSVMVRVTFFPDLYETQPSRQNAAAHSTIGPAVTRTVNPTPTPWKTVPPESQSAPTN